MNAPAPKAVPDRPHPLIAAALVDYDCKGVIPIRPESKHPYLLAWQKRTLATYPEIIGWYEQWPEALLGLVTGKASGVWMLDVDFRSGGAEALAALEAKHGQIPKTCCFNTPNGLRYGFKSVPGVYIR